MTMTNSSLYNVPKEQGGWRATALAVAVHGALIALLWFGVHWQNDTPVAVQAEVWSPTTHDAAPRPVTPEAPPPEPVPPAVPVPVPVPAPAPPPLAADTPLVPDIALEREKKRKALLRRQEQEQATERKQALAQAAADKEEETRKQKVQQQAALAREQKAEQQKNDQREARQEADQKLQQQKLQLQKLEQKKLLAEKQRRQDAVENQLAATERADQMRRLNAAASGSGGNGDAAKSQGSRADASYSQKVGAKIKSNTIFNGAEGLSTNPAVEFSVELLPDGSIRTLRKTRASGVPGFDEAVTRAIERSAPFPPDKSGTTPSGFTVSHKPKDQ